MSTADDKTGHKGTWIAIVVALPLLYVLSLGPAEYLDYHKKLSPGTASVLRAVYYPLTRLVDAFPWLEGPMSRYVGWWLDLGQKP